MIIRAVVKISEFTESVKEEKDNVSMKKLKLNSHKMVILIFLDRVY